MIGEVIELAGIEVSDGREYYLTARFIDVEPFNEARAQQQREEQERVGMKPFLSPGYICGVAAVLKAQNFEAPLLTFRALFEQKFLDRNDMSKEDVLEITRRDIVILLEGDADRWCSTVPYEYYVSYS